MNDKDALLLQILQTIANELEQLAKDREGLVPDSVFHLSEKVDQLKAMYWKEHELINRLKRKNYGDLT